MTVSPQELVELAIDHINDTDTQGVTMGKSADTILISSDSSIDSLSLVRLLLEIERLAEEDYNISITVVDESVFEAEVSPFSTVGSLTEHVKRLIG